MKKSILILALAFLLQPGKAQNQDPDVLKSDALMAQSIDDFASAAQLFEAAVLAYEEKGVFDTLSVYRAGINNIRLKKHERALEYLNKMVLKQIESADLYHAMADAFIGLNNFEEAQIQLEKIPATNPEEAPQAYRKLTTVCFNGRKFEDAIMYADKSLENQPGDSHILLIKMMAQAQSGKVNEAIKTGEDLLALDPENPRANEQVGLLLSRITDMQYDREKKRYDNLANPTRVDYSNTRKKLADISQQYRKAIPHLEKALAANPNNTTVKNALENARRRLNE